MAIVFPGYSTSLSMCKPRGRVDLFLTRTTTHREARAPVKNRTSTATEPSRTADAQPKFPWDQGHARDRLQELLEAGCKKEEIESFLITLGLAAAAGVLDGAGTVPQGLTRRRLKYLATRLRQLAEDVEHLNTNKFYDPKEWLPPTGVAEPSVRTVLVRDFTLLPRILARYADYLEVRNKQLSGFRKGPGRGSVAKRYLIRKLMSYVRVVTGHPFYDALAELLSASLPDDPIYTADALRKLDSRHTVHPSAKKPAINH
jgi:hypothetical protein